MIYIEEKAKTSLVRNELEKILNVPSMMTKKSDPYFRYISQAWEEFDKIPHSNYSHNDFDYFVRLKNNVIIPLGLNPNLY